MATANAFSGHLMDSPGAAGALVIVALVILIILGRLNLRVNVS